MEYLSSLVALLDRESSYLPLEYRKVWFEPSLILGEGGNINGQREGNIRLLREKERGKRLSVNDKRCCCGDNLLYNPH